MNSVDVHDDRLLFSQIANGDETAYTSIFHQYTPKLYPYILKITKEEQLAKELLQETFLRLWINRDDLKKINNPSAWLFKIAANLCLQYLRTQAIRNQLKAKVFSKMKPGEYSAEAPSEKKELELLIHKAIASLPEKRKEIYLLSREQELSYQQIADKLGISVNTVKNQIGLSIKAIQTYLHQHTGLSMTVLLILLGC